MNNHAILSVKDQARILAEERFRLEVKKQLSSNKETTLLDVLNAPITIWFLSSCVISVLGVLYSRTVEAAQSKKMKNERIRRLCIEIYFKVAKSLINVPAWEKQGSSLLDASPIYPEFDGRDLVGCAAELSFYVSNSSDNSNLFSIPLELIGLEHSREVPGTKEAVLDRLHRLQEIAARLGEEAGD